MFSLHLCDPFVSLPLTCLYSNPVKIQRTFRGLFLNNCGSKDVLSFKSIKNELNNTIRDRPNNKPNENVWIQHFVYHLVELPFIKFLVFFFIVFFLAFLCVVKVSLTMDNALNLIHFTVVTMSLLILDCYFKHLVQNLILKKVNAIYGSVYLISQLILQRWVA